MLRILIADDHTVVRKGLRQILLDEFPGAEIGEVADGGELVKKVMSDRWDVVVTDLSNPLLPGIDRSVTTTFHLPAITFFTNSLPSATSSISAP